MNPFKATFKACKSAAEFLAKKATACALAVTAATAAVVSAIDGAVCQVHAALAPADEALIQAGITSSDATFYKIGGGVLVVLAGIWGFKKVAGMFGR